MTDHAETHLVRDLGPLGMLTFTDNGKSRIYRHEPTEGKAVRLTSVTTILNALAKPALVIWSEEQGIIGTVEALRRGLIDPLALDDPRHAVRVVRDNQLGADAAKNKAARRGLTIHDALESWCGGEDLPEPALMDPEHRPYLQGLARALLKLDPDPISVEQITASLEHGYAGRYDLLAVIDGQRTLVDLKTSKNGRGYPEAHLQVEAYRLAEHELGVEPIDRCMVVGVGEDGSFCDDPGCSDPETFLSVLAAHRGLAAVRRGLSAADRAAKAAA